MLKLNTKIMIRISPREKAEALASKYLGTIVFNIRQNIEADCVEAAIKSALLCIYEQKETVCKLKRTEEIEELYQYLIDVEMELENF